MQPKPRNQAVAVVRVLAGHLRHQRALLELVLADRALVQLGVQQLVVNGDGGEILDGVLGGGRRAVAVGIIVGELLNELLKAGAHEVVADVRREAKPLLLGRVAKVNLDVGAVGAKALNVVLEENHRVEHVGFGSGPGYGGEKEREQGEGDFGIRRFLILGEKIRVRVVRVAFFYETFHTDRAEGFRLIGARDPLTAHVAEERLCSASAAAGRHDASSLSLSSSSIATQTTPLIWFPSFFFPFSNRLKKILLYITGRARGCWPDPKKNNSPAQ